MKIEGIRHRLEFGHYESDEEGSWLMPDFSYTSEITARISADIILNKLNVYRLELIESLNQQFERFEKDYRLKNGG